MNNVRRSQRTVEAGSREANFQLVWSGDGFPERCSIGCGVKNEGEEGGVKGLEHFSQKDRLVRRA